MAVSKKKSIRSKKKPARAKKKAVRSRKKSTSRSKGTTSAKKKTTRGKKKLTSTKKKTTRGKKKTAGTKKKANRAKKKATSAKKKTTRGKKKAASAKKKAIRGKKKAAGTKKKTTRAKKKAASGKKKTTRAKKKAASGKKKTTRAKKKVAGAKKKATRGKKKVASAKKKATRSTKKAAGKKKKSTRTNKKVASISKKSAATKKKSRNAKKPASKAISCGCPGPGYASPQEAIKAPREKVVYTICIYTGTGIEKPDYLATIDVDEQSSTYGQVIHRCEMPTIGDELHHMGWNACSSCNQDASMSRRYLIVPGVRTGNFYIVDTASNPRKPKLFKTITGDEIKKKTNLSAPHTVHCLGSEIIVSMLGDADGNAPGGFLHLNKNFEIVGRWENDISGMNYNYDFWYQPRHNMMVSTEWAAPNTFMPGFDLADVADGKYGRHIHFWDFEGKRIEKSVDLGGEGMIPLEVRFHHDPDSTHGFVGATLSSNIHHWYKDKKGEVVIEKIIDVEPIDVDNFPVPMPGLITDILVSMDDKYLYFSNWLHGDLRQYDISDPSNPKLTGQLFMGGLLGKAPVVGGIDIHGAPQMIQLSLDGKRLYVTTSLFSTWDNQFYPDIKDKGGQMFIIDCDINNGGMTLREDFVVDFGKEPNGPARAHETRYPGGDCSSDIWI